MDLLPFVGSDVLRKVRSGSDKGHIPQKDVKYLWDLIYRGFSYKLSYAGEPRIILRIEGGSVSISYIGGIYLHAPEFEHLKNSSVPSESSRIVKDRTFVCEPDPRSNEYNDKEDEGKSDEGQSDI